MDLYPYRTPPGYGDTFFVYAFDGDALTSGNNYYNQRIVISDGDFIARWWKGVDSLGNISQKIQIRDHLSNQYFGDFISPNVTPASLMNPFMDTGWPILPEKWYPDSGYIGFDLQGALPIAAQVGQLAFGGVRRRKGYRNDPQPSVYPWKEESFCIPVSFTLPIGWSNSSGGFLVTQEIPDYDFELRRIDGFSGLSGIAATLVIAFVG